MTLDEISKAKECFITSTTKQVLPVGQIDDIVLPQRKIAHQLLQRFRSACKREM